MSTTMQKMQKIAERAKSASRQMAEISDATKRTALERAASAIGENENAILKANQKDLESGKKKKLSSALLDRLLLNAQRVSEMAGGVREIAALPDPVGEVAEEWVSRAGIKIQKVRVPLGVIVMVYESRPNVTVESAALCLKAGNAVILRGGREAIQTNTILSAVFARAVNSAGVPDGAVQLVSDTARKNIYDLCRMKRWVDLVIARGSEQMVEEIRKRATVSVLGHGKGVCHVYVDAGADLKMAEEIAFNAKVQRPGVCNAMESLLIHDSVAEKFLPVIAKRYQNAGVALKGDRTCRKIFPGMKPAAEKDWSTEYLNLELSVKVVDSVESAIEHINRYGSGHTDAIVTEDLQAQEKFLKRVDSAAVFHNISTRMHDGGVFGLGAEIGISTQKLHARGTMGVRELTTTKYVATGSGHVRT